MIACSYNVLDGDNEKSGKGVWHTVEMNAIWGDIDALPKSYKSYNSPIVEEIQGYWTSFIRTLDPNKFRKEGSAEWKPWIENSRLLFELGNTRMENVSNDEMERCRYFASIAPMLQQ